MTYVEIQTAKKTYTIPEWMWNLVEDLEEFDLDFVLETVERGKYLHILDQAVFQ
jgi:hypothetical protein